MSNLNEQLAKEAFVAEAWISRILIAINVIDSNGNDKNFHAINSVILSENIFQCKLNF